MQWNNAFQKELVSAYLEGIAGGKAPSKACKDVAGKYGVSVYIVKGLAELEACEGLTRVKGENAKTQGHKFAPVNYHVLANDLQERVRALERKFAYLLEGIQRVLDDGETMRVHLQHLRGMGKWMAKGERLDSPVRVIEANTLHEEE